jgi:hypothetical protein
MSRFDIVNIPLMRVTRKVQMICHRSILTTGQIEEFGKSCLEGLIPTLHVMLESNFGAINNF